MKRKRNTLVENNDPMESLSDATQKRLARLKSAVDEARKNPSRSLTSSEEERRKLQRLASQIRWGLALMPLLLYFVSMNPIVATKSLIIKGALYAFAGCLFALYYHSVTTLGPAKRAELEEWRWKQNRRAFLYKNAGILFVAMAIAGTNPGYSNIYAQVSFAAGFASLILASGVLFAVHWHPRLYISQSANIALIYLTLIAGNAIVMGIILKHASAFLLRPHFSITAAILLVGYFTSFTLVIAYMDRKKNEIVLLQRLSLQLVRPQRLLDALAPEMDAARARLRAQHLLSSLEKGEEYRVRLALAAYLAADYGPPPKKMTALVISLVTAGILFVVSAIAEDWVQTLFEPLKQMVLRSSK